MPNNAKIHLCISSPRVFAIYCSGSEHMTFSTSHLALIPNAPDDDDYHILTPFLHAYTETTAFVQQSQNAARLGQ